MDAPQKPDTIKRYDNPAPLFPGEHWVDLAGGIAAWLLTRKHPSLAVRTLGTFLGATFSASCTEAAPYCWTVALRAGAARKTNYDVWLRESPDQLRALWTARREAQALRNRLPHEQRRKKPWGPL